MKSKGKGDSVSLEAFTTLTLDVTGDNVTDVRSLLKNFCAEEKARARRRPLKYPRSKVGAWMRSPTVEMITTSSLEEAFSKSQDMLQERGHLVLVRSCSHRPILALGRMSSSSVVRVQSLALSICIVSSTSRYGKFNGANKYRVTSLIQ